MRHGKWALLAVIVGALTAFAALLAAPAERVLAASGRAPVVLAAASLQECLTAAGYAWARQGHPRPVLSFAASSALARQIEAGAPADVFVSADEEWMDYLVARRLVAPGSRANVATNRLALVAPAGSRLRLEVRAGFPLARALGAGRLAMADPATVPAGRYGRAALTRLGVWRAVEGRVASAENVRVALALVARGEAPLGIVYATDARAEAAVRIVGLFPVQSHPPIVYPAARIAGSRNAEAEGFRQFLLSAEGQAIFRRFGFGHT